MRGVDVEVAPAAAARVSSARSVGDGARSPLRPKRAPKNAPTPNATVDAKATARATAVSPAIAARRGVSGDERRRPSVFAFSIARRKPRDARYVHAVPGALRVGQVVPQVAAIDGDLVRVRVRARLGPLTLTLTLTLALTLTLTLTVSPSRSTRTCSATTWLGL